MASHHHLWPFLLAGPIWILDSESPTCPNSIREDPGPSLPLQCPTCLSIVPLDRVSYCLISCQEQLCPWCLLLQPPQQNLWVLPSTFLWLPACPWALTIYSEETAGPQLRLPPGAPGPLHVLEFLSHTRHPYLGLSGLYWLSPLCLAPSSDSMLYHPMSSTLLLAHL